MSNVFTIQAVGQFLTTIITMITNERMSAVLTNMSCIRHKQLKRPGLK